VATHPAKKKRARSVSPVTFLKVQRVRHSLCFYLQLCRKLQKTYCQGLQKEHSERNISSPGCASPCQQPQHL